MTTPERTRVDNTSARGEAPCIAACPINQDARDYVQLIARGRFEEAFRLVRSKNTFPASCGRICTRRCEDACRRSAIDEPIAIAWLKRFLSDKDFSPSLENRKARYQEKVAIVGAGPAGLTAANDLSLLGYKCVIFEELLEPGGMLRTGVPRYRLPGHSLDSDISDILRLGVELRTGVKLGLDITVDTLFEEDFKAVFIGIGAHKSLRLDVPGEDLAGVIPAVEFLRKISLGKTINLGEKVVVIGGGDTALDSARTALRVGAKEVTIVYRRSVEEMPCEKVGRLEAEEEGVRFKFLTSPVELLGNDGVKVVKCVKMELGEPDQSGRRRPIPVAGSEFVMDVDNVIMAIGQLPELSSLNDSGLGVTSKNVIGVEEETLATNRPGVFAGGDAVNVGGTLIEAIAHGRRAAAAIHGYLRGKGFDASKGPTPMTDISSRRIGLIKRELRKKVPILSAGIRARDFSEVELGYSDQLAMMEARRCLNCGAGAEVDPELCAACLTCVRVCPYDVPELNRVEKKAKIGVDCQSCGICVVECPARAITLKDRYEDRGMDGLKKAVEEFSGPESGPRVVVFLCLYDSQSEVVVSRLGRTGSNIKTVQVSCIGKLDPTLMLKAFEEWADGVVVAGCLPGECPYQTGHSWAKRRFDYVAGILSDMGLEAERFQWLSPSPTEQFFKEMEQMTEELKKLGPVFKRSR
jgi:NADPH-dependent glutamate synthase beta subunit-like oxidoreductase/coenzyme F420-reducing hydrogenase delta subunit